MYRWSSALLLIVGLSAQAQTPGGGTTGGGESTPSVQVEIEAQPGVNLPVGTEVELTESHEPESLEGESIQWIHCPCVGKSPLHCSVVPENATKILKFCNGAANKDRFKVEVSHTDPNFVSPGTAEIEIKWNAPNRMKFQYEALAKIFTPATPEIPAGEPHGPQDAYPAGFFWLNKLNVTLYYGDEPIGPCALICATEFVRREPLHACARDIDNDSSVKKTQKNPEGARMFPKECEYKKKRLLRGDGIPFISGVPETTFDWDSPTLTDSHILAAPLNSDQLDISAITDGTPIFRVRRQYLFKGPQCLPRLQPTTGEDVNFWILKSDFIDWIFVVRTVNGVKKIVLEGPSEWPASNN